MDVLVGENHVIHSPESWCIRMRIDILDPPRMSNFTPGKFWWGKTYGKQGLKFNIISVGELDWTAMDGREPHTKYTKSWIGNHYSRWLRQRWADSEESPNSVAHDVEYEVQQLVVSTHPKDKSQLWSTIYNDNMIITITIIIIIIIITNIAVIIMIQYDPNEGWEKVHQHPHFGKFQVLS